MLSEILCKYVNNKRFPMFLSDRDGSNGRNRDKHMYKDVALQLVGKFYGHPPRGSN